MSVTLARKTQFYHQLSAGYQAGLPAEMLLQSAVQMVSSTALAESLLLDIQKGRSLSSALAAKNLISSWEANLLSIGESSGRLDAVLQDLEWFFEGRSRLYREIKSRLHYVFILILFGIVVPPLPQLASGDLAVPVYVAICAFKILLLITCWQLLLIRPFEKSANAAFNPLLIKSLKLLCPEHLCREIFEVAYLNLLSLCMESGLDAAETLKLLKDSSNNKALRRKHQVAVSRIQNHGQSLTSALTAQGILQNSQIISFLNSSEHTGTLHSALRKFVERKKGEVTASVNFQIRRLSQWLYLAVIFSIAFGII